MDTWDPKVIICTQIKRKTSNDTIKVQKAYLMSRFIKKIQKKLLKYYKDQMILLILSTHIT